jgi:hypothetical protein
MAWIRSVFEEVNQLTSAKLSRIPNIHETSLDMAIMEQFSQYANFQVPGGLAFAFPS